MSNTLCTNIDECQNLMLNENTNCKEYPQYVTIYLHLQAQNYFNYCF